MNWVDLIISGLFVWAVVDGVRKGFADQVIDLVSLAVAVLVALSFYHAVADWLVRQYDLPVLLAKPAAFFALWFILDWLTRFIGRWLYGLLSSRWKHSIFNRALGPVPALFKTWAYVGILATLLISLPVPADVKAGVQESRLAPLIIQQTGSLTAALERGIGGKFGESFNFLTTTSPSEPVQVPRVSDPDRLVVEPNIEERLLALVNEERSRIGLQPVVADRELREVARAHSRDMWLRGYFDHVNPDGADPFDRMRAAGVTFEAAGENLALAPSVEIAHFGLMRSPEHRENILHPDFHRLGIGIISAGSDGFMVTQNFRN